MRLPFLLAVLISAPVLCAQQVDTIRANPNAVTLRQFWRIDGTAAEEALGAGFGPLGNIFHTGTSAWAVMSNGPREIAIYVYDTATKTVQRRQTISQHSSSFTTPLSPAPIVGNFFGNDSLLVMLDERQTIHHFFSVGDSLLDTIPRFILSASIMGAAASDLDRDGADELILLTATSQGTYLCLYRGGTNFTVDTPTLIINDNIGGGGNYLYVTDLDRDHLPDILVGGAYPDPITPGQYQEKLKVYHIDSTLWNWTSDHAADNIQAFSGAVGIADCDGDSIIDIAKVSGPNRISLFRSRTGKSWFTRTFDSNDADNTYTRPNFGEPINVGPLSDSTGRYGTMALVSGGSHLIFSGGVNGPDAQWDAVGGGSLWTKPALDCDGDGWQDYMTGDGHSGAAGYCTIYAGGPEIPRDPTVGVRWLAVTGERERAIAVWPNPARDVVHIAWRGDLRRFPRMFRVHDATGALVASGSVDGGAEVAWDCSARPDGRYTLTVLDANGTILASTPLMIQS